ncbi:SGNH/GDSL hydrolase family protein [Cerasicoccus frondis]|uniref:SGNH/GDSL hydrolase family protein n=1 Tax=Cerasicoccus frondis TaxID=490090 RepID=UPI0028529F8C|nr:SGNH/GDSL hydrolase family protein [Cerasicoccus frondis]
MHNRKPPSNYGLNGATRILLILTLILCSTKLTQAGSPEYLFIGNSFTIGSGDPDTTKLNGVPGMVALLAESAGHEKPYVEKCTQAGYSLQDHLKDSRKWNFHINKNKWTGVVLQEFSTVPTSADSGDHGNKDTFFECVEKIAKIVKSNNPKAKLYLFQTWARGPTHNIYFNQFPEGPKQMYAELRESYQEAANLIDATLIPVGDAWELSQEKRPDFNLYAKDRYHAQTRGSYLNALVIYSVIYDADPRGLPPLSTVSEEDANYLQEVAWQTVSGE